MAKKTSTKKPTSKRPEKSATKAATKTASKPAAKKGRGRAAAETNGRHRKSASSDTMQQTELPIELPLEIIDVAIEEAIEFPAAELEPEAPAAATAVASQRLLPLGEELQNLYARYSAGSTFDDHDKAFYFVLDVGGVSRARQLINHVEEVLSELEEFLT